MRLIFLALFLAVMAAGGCEKRRTPSRFLIPHDYEGVVITVYEQTGFPPLPIVDGYRVHRYPIDGVLITSSSMESGRGKDLVEDLLPNGDKQRLPGKFSTGRRERGSSTGSSAGFGLPTLTYLNIAIGTDEYWAKRDAREFEEKLEEARNKIKQARTPSNQ